MYSKGIVALMLVLVFFIPGVYGISVTMYGEDGGNSFYDATTYSALDHDSLMVHSAVNGATLLQDASGNGDLHKIFGASNHLGEKAQITADVVNAGSWQYTQPVIAADTTTASVTGFTLTATDANSIKCTSGATDKLGDKASAAIEVIQGSLNNYHGDAFASSTGVNAMQSFDAVVGLQVKAKETASNPTGSTVTNTNVQNGGIFGYSNFGETFAYPYFIETLGQFELAEGSAVSADSSALKTSGSRSNTKMSVLGTETQPASVFGYGTAAGLGYFFETGAQQVLFGGANGNVIGLAASSSNAERDISSSKTDILGTETVPGSISGYFDLTESFRDGVFAQNSFSQAGGNEIHLSTSASNRENDRANANMNAVGDGQITNFGSSASATLKTATASDSGSGLSTSGDVISSGLSISGDVISYDASASDAARNRASVGTSVLNGFIVDPTNSATVDNTLVQSLSASQSATIVSGSLAKITAIAVNAAQEQKILPGGFINPSGITYTNSASVQNGIPDVLQTAIA
jgi:hypothetical protein